VAFNFCPLAGGQILFDLTTLEELRRNEHFAQSGLKLYFHDYVFLHTKTKHEKQFV